MHNEMKCARYAHEVLRQCSSGLRRLKGGDARTAELKGANLHDWAVVSGSGESVEVWKKRDSPWRDPVVLHRDLTMGKILYFF